MQLYLKNFKYSIFLSLLLIPLYYFFLYSNMWNIFKAQTIFGDLNLSRLLYKFVKLNPSVLEGQQPFRDLLKTINFSSQGFLLNDINEKEFKDRFIDI